MRHQRHRTATPCVAAATLISALAVYAQAATATDLPAAVDSRSGSWQSRTPSPQAAAGLAWAALTREFPKAVASRRGERVTAVFGVPMTPDSTPRKALENWMAHYAAVFGVEDLEWSEVRAADIGNGRTAFALRQELTVEGGILRRATRLPVEGGRLRMLSAKEGQNFAITYAAARVLDTSRGIGPPWITATEAIREAGADERTSDLKVWLEPELVVIENDSGAGPELISAWRMAGRESERAADTTRIAYVNAETGQLVRVRSGVAGSEPVAGTVSGGITAGFDPPRPGSTIEASLPQATVCIVGEDCTTTAFDGTYELQTASSTVDVEATLDSGYWYVVESEASDPVALQRTVSPPALTVDLTFNPIPPATQADTAAVNIFINIHRSNAFFAERVANWGAVLATLPALKGQANYQCATCGGGYFIAPASIALCRTLLPSCNNGAYTTIISHEYGHYIAYHVIEALFPVAFVEGYADTLALLVHDTDEIGHDYKPGRPLRRPALWDTKFPACFTDKYRRSTVLSRIWWDIRMTIAMGLPAVRDLFVDWTLLASGPAAPQCLPALDQAADQDTLIEVLIADDDDNIIVNGTPNDEVICEAFAGRDIDTQFAGSPCP